MTGYWSLDILALSAAYQVVSLEGIVLADGLN